jgi:hypothetical protein
VHKTFQKGLRTVQDAHHQGIESLAFLKKAFLENGIEPIIDRHCDRLANSHGQKSESERPHSLDQGMRLQMSVYGGRFPGALIQEGEDPIRDNPKIFL